MKRSWSHGRHQTHSDRKSCALRSLQSPGVYQRIRGPGWDDLPRVFRDGNSEAESAFCDEGRAFEPPGRLSALNRAAEINNGELLLLVVLVALSSFLAGMYAKNVEWPKLVQPVEARR